MSTAPLYRGDAPAKLNLTLRILGTRPDGFHELESLVARVDLCDTLEVTPQEDGRYQFECDDPGLTPDGSNLVLRAARELARRAPTNHGADFRLFKRIPAGAGLGGGSSDAAAALRILNEAWRLDRPRAELMEIGAELGSDIPLFFRGPRCVLRGRGEIVEDVDAPLSGWAVLLLPPIACATPAVYRAWDGLSVRPQRPAIEDVLAALRGCGGGAEAVMPHLFNDLEDAALAAYPELADVFARAAALAGGAVRMTGSGSAIYRLFDAEPQARAFAEEAHRALAIRTEVAALTTT